MAVQDSRRTRSTRGMRRNQKKLTANQLSTDQETGELHLRHHVTNSGYYRGKKIITKVVKSKVNEEINEE